MPISRAMEILRRTKVTHSADLLSKPGVHSVGIGVGPDPQVGDPLEGGGLVVLYREPPPEDLPPGQGVPPFVPYEDETGDEAFDVPVFVWIAALPTRSELPGVGEGVLRVRSRPCLGGVGIGRANKWATGTLGGWVWDDIDDQIVLLSNAHVLGREGDEDRIVQPSFVYTDEEEDDLVAWRTREAPWPMDAAIAKPVGPESLGMAILGLGPAVFEVEPVLLPPAIEAAKTGSRTGVSTGLIRATEFDGELEPYEFVIVGEWNEAAVVEGGGGWDAEVPATAFSYKGDSGSLVLKRDMAEDIPWRCVLGLIWGDGDALIDGVNRQVSYAIRITDVFQKLSLMPICTGILVSLVGRTIAAAAGWLSPSGDTAPSGENTNQLPPHSYAISELPPPPGEEDGKAGFFQGFARAFEKQIGETHVGSEFLALLREHRIGVVRVLLDQNGWMTTTNALAPFLAGVLTTDQVLEHRITETDVRNINLAMETAYRVSQEVEPIVGFIRLRLDGAEGKALGTIIFGEEWRA